MRRAWLRLGSVAFLVLAVVLAVLAFTRFDGGAPPDPASPAYQDYERQRLADAQMSVVFGIGASFALLGSLACHSAAGKPSSEE